MMHGLVEMDVAKAHQYMREYKARTRVDIIDGAPATRCALRLKELLESGYGLIEQFFQSQGAVILLPMPGGM